jgi:hypothetical protein
MSARGELNQMTKIGHGVLLNTALEKIIAANKVRILNRYDAVSRAVRRT